MNYYSLIYTLLAAFFAFSWRISHKKLVKVTKNDFAFTAITDLFAALFLLIAVLVTKDFSLAKEPSIFIWLVISASLSGLGDYLLLYANKNADTSDTTILMPLSNFWVLLFGILFVGEDITLGKLIGVPLIILGSVITLWKGRKGFTINKGIGAAILYGIVITGTVLIDKEISQYFGTLIYAFLFFCIASGVLLLMLGKNHISKLKEELSLNLKNTFIIGVQWALFSLFLLMAYRYEDASRVVPLMRVFIVFVTIYSVLYLKEKDRLFQKVIGAIVVTVGALVLSFVK